MGIMASPHKHPRTGVYYFRMGVPKELRDIIGKTEFKTSLRTKNLTEAKRLFPAHLEDAHKQLELARLKLLETSNVELSPSDCAIIAERWYERVKAEVDNSGDYSRFLTYEKKTNQVGEVTTYEFGLSDTLPVDGREVETATEQQLQELSDSLKEFIIEQLDLEELIVLESSDSFRRLVLAFYRYVYRIEALCRARYKHDYGYDPIASSIAHKPLSVSRVTEQKLSVSSKSPKDSISSVLKRYIESATINGKASQSIAEVTHQIERLIELIGDIDVTEVNRGHISQFRDTLLQLPKSKAQDIRSKSLVEQIELVKAKDLPKIAPSTVKAILRKTSPLFGYAFELGLIDVNPFKGVTLPKVHNKSEVAEEKGYSPAEIDLLFRSGIFTDATTRKPYGMACYWVPLLCRYTGARIEEMVQLRKSDVQRSEDGIYFLYVREGADQNLKNVMSVRHVPIHGHLIELGFLDYVASSGEFLFSDLKAGTHGKRSPYLVKWWSQRVKDAGVITNQPSHSFRHSLKTALRGLGVLDSVADSVAGHSPANVGASYGTVDLQTKKKAIDRLPRLALSRLW